MLGCCLVSLHSCTSMHKFKSVMQVMRTWLRHKNKWAFHFPFNFYCKHLLSVRQRALESRPSRAIPVIINNKVLFHTSWKQMRKFVNQFHICRPPEKTHQNDCQLHAQSRHSLTIHHLHDFCFAHTVHTQASICSHLQNHLHSKVLTLRFNKKLRSFDFIWSFLEKWWLKLTNPSSTASNSNVSTNHILAWLED